MFQFLIGIINRREGEQCNISHKVSIPYRYYKSIANIYVCLSLWAFQFLIGIINPGAEKHGGATKFEFQFLIGIINLSYYRYSIQL